MKFLYLCTIDWADKAEIIIAYNPLGMVKNSIIGSAVALLAAMMVACGGGGASKGHLVDAADSLSYVMGMNIAYNLMQMDSTVRPDAVMEGIEDGLRERAVMTWDDATRYFLGYHNFDIYERVRSYEEQYLNDLAASDNTIVRSESGLTYKVGELGDMGRIAAADRDTVSITYRVTNIEGEEVDLVENRADTLRVALRGLIPGLKEGVSLVGEGGSITLWIPSSQAYGSAGDAEKGIEANEMLRYEVNIIEVKHRR